jgi:hypothetical protein
MIVLVEVSGGGIEHAQKVARRLEEEHGWEILSVAGLGIQDRMVITAREPAAPVDRLASNLLKGLRLAIVRLACMEPGDSRAVSSEFVALAALSSGDQSPAVMDVIERSLRHAGK